MCFPSPVSLPSWTARLLALWTNYTLELELLNLRDRSSSNNLLSKSSPFSLHIDGPFHSSGFSLMQPEVRECVLIGLGSGVTAPLGLLSHFLRYRFFALGEGSAPLF